MSASTSYAYEIDGQRVPREAFYAVACDPRRSSCSPALLAQPPHSAAWHTLGAALRLVGQQQVGGPAAGGVCGTSPCCAQPLRCRSHGDAVIASVQIAVTVVYIAISRHPPPVHVECAGAGACNAVHRLPLVRALKHHDRLERRLDGLAAVAVALPGARQLGRAGRHGEGLPIARVEAVVLLPVAVALGVELRRVLPLTDHGPLRAGAAVELHVDPGRLREAAAERPAHHRVDDQPGILDCAGHAVVCARAGERHAVGAGVQVLG